MMNGRHISEAECRSMLQTQNNNALRTQAFVHQTKPTKSRFETPENREPPYYKPHHGMWTSPLQFEGLHLTSPWLQFVSPNDGTGFTEESRLFWLYPNPDAEVYVLDDTRDLDKLIEKYGYQNPKELIEESYIDFEWMAEDYDALYLTENGLRETKWGYPNRLAGWDVESVLWLSWEFETVRELGRATEFLESDQLSSL